MSIKSKDVSLSTTPANLATLLSSSDFITRTTISNFSGVTIIVGDSNITSSTNGIKIFNGTTIELDFDHRDDALNNLYIVAVSGTPTIQLLVR